MVNTTKIRNMRTEHTASFYLQEAYYLARELEQMPADAPERSRTADETLCAAETAVLTARRVHTPLQESSKTADDGASAPREWCSRSGCMVHSGRRHGAHGRRAFPLFGDTFALAHGFALDLDGVGVVDDPVTDGIGQGGVVQILVPLTGVVLGAEDGGGHLAPSLY